MAQRNVLEHYIEIKRTEERTGNKGLFIHTRSLPCEDIVVSFPRLDGWFDSAVGGAFSHSSINKFPFSWAPRTLSYFHQKTENLYSLGSEVQAILFRINPFISESGFFFLIKQKIRVS